MEQVKTISLTGMSNVYHISTHTSVINLVKKTGAANLGLDTSLVTRYESAITIEQDLVNRTTASDKTVLIRQHDTERCNLFRYVLNIIACMQYSNDATLAAGAPTAESKILSKYGLSIIKEGDQKKSALIRGFVVDVRKFLSDYIAKLGIESALTALTTANEAFQTAFLERVNEQATDVTSTKELRAETDLCYNKIVACVNYYASCDNASDEVTIMTCDTCTDFIKNLNVLLKRIRQCIKTGEALTDDDDDATGTSTNSGTGSSSAASAHSGTSGTSTSSVSSDL